jgi:lipopolysaccharide/colanic/teichoic acid biosynthesis glycosyltransferase
MGAPVRLSGWRDPEAEQIWDWLALRQSFLQGEAEVAKPHWLQDPLAARPVAAALRRVCDVALAALLLAALWPVIAACMALVRLTSRGPALFRQRRIGYQCATFSMFKLRTMVEGAQRLEDRLSEASGGTFLKLAHDPRTTRVGRLLRKYSLDELPQLLNVLRGDMSLVGPRPLLLSDFQKFPKQEQMRRFSVRPGLTGLWQVSGRSATTDAERIQLDLEYVERWSPWLDLTILARTLPAVLRAKGAH